MSDIKSKPDRTQFTNNADGYRQYLKAFEAWHKEQSLLGNLKSRYERKENKRK